jgi:hypothetical protein
VTVGSETLYRGNFTGEQLLAKILDVKQALGGNFKCGTADSVEKGAKVRAQVNERMREVSKRLILLSGDDCPYVFTSVCIHYKRYPVSYILSSCFQK